MSNQIVWCPENLPPNPGWVKGLLTTVSASNHQLWALRRTAGRPSVKQDDLGGSTMKRHVLALATVLLLPSHALAAQAAPDAPRPGAPGAGDPYFPLMGNGGYDVRHYQLDIDYDPATDRLEGVARIRARTTQALSRFDLDLDGLTVRSVRVRGSQATWTRNGGELVVTPAHPLRQGQSFMTVVRYDGIPVRFPDGTGVIPTDDGALILGEPFVASSWFPANDHPTDKASFTTRVTVPRGLEVVGNGALTGVRHRKDTSTWTWYAREPMAPYLATASIGEFRVNRYRADGLRFWDAIDPDLFDDPAPPPRTGSQYAWSQRTEDAASYRRLSRTITVPAGGAELSFWVDRDTEEDWDFMFVEAHAVGSDDWTTLPDENGHTSQDTGFSCPFWHELHPFLTHYQTENGDGSCDPEGTTGEWWAASGRSDGYELWTVDLSDYAGGQVELAISYATDDFVQLPGVFVDDVAVSTGEGSTSFEDDGNALDGWQVPGPPPGSEPNEDDWTVTTAVELEPLGTQIQASFDRQPEMIRFLESKFGPYPFATAGGVVDDADAGFALENQTRPVYPPIFWVFGAGDSVVVHEIAHQWYGDHVAVARWRHIWLNEGFATYAEWLWSGEEGFDTPQQIFESLYNEIPEDDPFWELRIGDPGPDHLFDGPVYDRGAMTLQALRNEIGDRAFFRVLRAWAAGDGNGSTNEFKALAERVSGEPLDALFRQWLFTSGRPDLGAPAAAGAASEQMSVTTKELLRGLSSREGARH
jgi:hypothetical protein